ncbi:GNAT family N-acetyltransferase [Vallicoccus soli]|uniref:N-acetyltransferase n=1 Tax=Vallicoccus soli TaxID=2339232 RepID=A0A3A3YTI3_9ACTN|nr:N-acetyltransferase [Vallicoccus soli]RJK94784.1 N-acetyltransferase [Vallicoccus soli]
MVLVRRELPADVPAVHAVHVAAFADGARTEAPLAAALRTGGHLLAPLTLVAEAGGAVVGSVVTSAGSLAGQRVPALGPVGVLPAHQGRGIGGALLHAVLGAADALGEPCVVLLGDPALYGRYGFGPAEGAGVRAPDPAWGAHFQLRRLTAWDPGLAGVFRYAPPFDGL